MKILVVEDEALLALELASELESVGHEIAGQAMSLKEAVAIIEETPLDLAFVDLHLADGFTGIAIGDRLSARGIPFVFVTGNVKRIPDDYTGAIGAIEKPYTVNGLTNAVRFIERLIAGEAVPADAPPSLRRVSGLQAV